MPENADLGKLLLRLTLGILLLFHGVHKAMHGAAWIGNMLAAHGLPSWFYYAVFIGEILAPLMIVTGIYMRIGAALVVVNMIVAFALVHSHQILQLTAQGGWQLELQGFYLFTAVSLLFLGAGRYRLKT